MNIADFELIAGILKENSGLALTQDKVYLLESRLNPLARKRNLAGVSELIAQVRRTKDRVLIKEITEAMTTNESFFFRDQRPFDQFRDIVLPHLLRARAGSKLIRVWSAACSNGQESYSLAMILKESAARLGGWKVEILATDISSEVLAKAKAGLYSQFEVQRGLPVQLMVKNFTQEGDRWRISDGLRRMIRFEPFNLLHDPQRLGKFDVVFCRNVLIYFDAPTKAAVLKGIRRVIAPDGFLYLGGAETVLGTSEEFHLLPGQKGIYGPVAAGQPLARAAG